MIIKSSGILIHLIRFKESSLICKVYTREFGLISCMANGVRNNKKTGAKGVVLQPLNQLDLVFYYHSNKSIHRLSDFQLKYFYLDIPNNYYKTLISSFLLEVLSKCLNEEGPNTELYDFLEFAFIALDKESYNPSFHLWFLSKMTVYLGIQPFNRYSESETYFVLEDGGFTNHPNSVTKSIGYPLSEYISELLQMEYSALMDWKITRQQRKQLLDIWLMYYKIHLENFTGLKSLKVIEDLMLSEKN